MNKAGANLRNYIYNELLGNVFCMEFCWVNGYPMFEKDDTTTPNRFLTQSISIPQKGIADLYINPLDIVAYQYDLVCNGVEICSGAVEIMIQTDYAKHSNRKAYNIRNKSKF